jgi:hypothetical protein
MVTGDDVLTTLCSSSPVGRVRGRSTAQLQRLQSQLVEALARRVLAETQAPPEAPEAPEDLDMLEGKLEEALADIRERKSRITEKAVDSEEGDPSRGE